MRKYGTWLAGWAMIRLLSVGMICLIGQAPAWAADRSAPPGIALISCDRNGAVLEISLPQIQFTPILQDGQPYTKVSIPGWGYLAEEGRPSLPSAAVFLALPPGAQATASVEVLESKNFPLQRPLPFPTMKVELNDEEPKEVFGADPKIYQSSEIFPQEWVTVGDPIWLRSYYAVPVRIHPVRYQAFANQASVAEKMRVHVRFRGGRSGQYINDPQGESLAQGAILNDRQARSWQEKSGGPPAQPAQAYGQFKVLVDRDGIYSITYYDLEALGINPLDIDPQTVQLKVKVESGGADTIAQIPIWVEDQGELDGEFDPDDYILFFGSAPRGTFTYGNLYTLNNVYWLDWGGLPGLRMSTRSVAASGSAIEAAKFLAGTRVEVDTMYEKFGFAPLTEDIDHWMWFKLDDNFDPEFSTLISLPQRETPPSGAAYNHYSLTASFRGFTYSQILSPDSLDHRVLLYWNNTGQQVLNVAFDIQDDTVATAAIPANYVSYSDPNEIIIQAPDLPYVVANAFYLDWLQVDYWRNYRVEGDTLVFQKPQNHPTTQNILYRLSALQDDSVELWDLTTMQKLVGFSRSGDSLTFRDLSTDSTYYYVAGRDAWLTPQIIPDIPSEWKNASNGADYLMITHEEFYDALQPLVDQYSDRGMRVLRVKVGDIYDEFNYGLKDPQAIFDFLQYAYYNYQAPAPGFVLLVGDASWDYRGFDNLPYQDFVPTHHFMSYKWGETASDNFFAALAGPDPVPDLALGRLPVNDANELDVLIQKTLSYAQAPPGYWRSRIIFTNGAASDTLDAPYMDSTAQVLVDTYFPEWYEPARVYIVPSTGNEAYSGTSEDLIEYWNQGVACVNYIGHAGNQMWETLNITEIPQLSNGAQQPFVSSYSCFTGIFSNTTGFGEALILEPDGGAVAYWSNAGIGYLYTNYYINYWLFDELFNAVALPTIGEATETAKAQYYALYGTSGNVVATFTLLGDPGSLFVYSDPNAGELTDDDPPQIVISAGDSLGAPFESGDFVANPVRFYFDVFDSTGLDAYQLELNLRRLSAEGDPFDTTYVMPADSALPEIGLFIGPQDSTGQHIGISFVKELAYGEWQFTISAFDTFGIGPTVETRVFNVGEELDFAQAPLNYPNPFSDETAFTFELTQPAQVTIKIFTVSGKLIKVLRRNVDAGYSIIEWDGRDAQGDPISNGAYLYKVIAQSGEDQIDKIQKMARIR